MWMTGVGPSDSQVDASSDMRGPQLPDAGTLAGSLIKGDRPAHVGGGAELLKAHVTRMRLSR